jgi:hypothetical protein
LIDKPLPAVQDLDRVEPVPRPGEFGLEENLSRGKGEKDLLGLQVAHVYLKLKFDKKFKECAVLLKFYKLLSVRECTFGRKKRFGRNLVFKYMFVDSRYFGKN